MRVTNHPDPFMAILNHDRILKFSERELKTVKSAVEIVEEARDRLRSVMGGDEFEGSAWYTLDCRDVAESGGYLEIPKEMTE